MLKNYDVILAGAGASGAFCAARILDLRPKSKVLLLEGTSKILRKVRISGGGRCNVTHSQGFNSALTEVYPRGGKHLRGSFSKFGFAQVHEWFNSKGVKLKEEEDGRVFPSTDDSQTIVDALVASMKGVSIQQPAMVTKVNLPTEGIKRFEVEFKRRGAPTGESAFSECVVFSSGSNPRLWKMVEEDLNIKVIDPVPSLFTLKTKDERLHGLSGISLPNVIVSFLEEHGYDSPKYKKLKKRNRGKLVKFFGPILITHTGLSGPVILKMSSHMAFELQKLNYAAALEIDLTGGVLHQHDIVRVFQKQRNIHPSKSIFRFCPLNNKDLVEGLIEEDAKSPMIPRRLWANIVASSIDAAGVDVWSRLSNADMRRIADKLVKFRVDTLGKSTYKEEFVTAGGVDLKELTKDFEVKHRPNIFCIGEFVNIDGITGGFNFTAAWSSGWHAGNRIVEILESK